MKLALSPPAPAAAAHAEARALLSDSPSAPIPSSPDPAPPLEALGASGSLSPEEVVRLAYLSARRRVDAHSARDIGQETWIKASREPEWSQWDAGRARAWVRAVAANAALDLRRKTRPQALRGERPGRAPDPAEALAEAEWSALERERARQILSDLSREDRELLAWRVVEGRSYAELAERWGLEPSSLRARFARLRARLEKEGS